jgi:uncharacterized phage-associated protein
MTVSAHDVAAAIRHRLPGIGTMKLHKLLYYCQGHHLTQVAEPLFGETISAWDKGPVVGTLWKAETTGEPPPPAADLDNDALGTIGYVISRYGALSGADLSRLTHHEDPWVRADKQRRGRGDHRATISHDALREWFATADQGDEDDEMDPEVIRQWLTDVAARPAPDPGEPLTRENLTAWARRAA